jgi:hypothetical protein
VRRVLPLLLVVAATTGLVACGNDDTEERNAYAGALNRVQSDFADSFRDLSGKITATTTPGQGRRTLQGFEDDVDAVVRDLRAIQAPDGIAPLHQRLISQIAGYRRAISRAKEAYASSSPRRILEAQTALVSATTAISGRINRTVAAINKGLQGEG